MSIYLAILIIMSIGCSKEQNSSKNYPEVIGTIEYDGLVDGEFERCGTFTTDTTTSFANSYYGVVGMKYKGELPAIREHILKQYISPRLKDQTGLLTIRFLVTCKGKTGMYRITGSDANLNEFHFSTKISEQISTAIKSLDGWPIAASKERGYDYYKYLHFKIVESEIIEIGP